MAISLPDGRELSDEVLECLRLRALHACELGFTEQEAADILGVGQRNRLARWWSAYTKEVWTCFAGGDELEPDALLVLGER